MLAPIDKIQRGGNDTIQIVVTTACSLFNCASCTQLLPFRRDYLHMSVDCFRKAVRSVKDWPGVVALFGGNPCSHPEFETLAAILEEEIPDQRRRGLWSNDTLRHGETVRRVFYPHGRFNMNAHRSVAAAARISAAVPGKLIPSSDKKPSMHSAVMAGYRDLGMSYGDFLAAREKCEINRNWSAAIVERDGRPYAYFCEVASAIEGVRGGNTGILATPGWWREPMKRFEAQLSACENCAVPFKVNPREDLSNTYDVGESWMPFTEGRRGEVAIEAVDGIAKRAHEVTDYMGYRK